MKYSEKISFITFFSLFSTAPGLYVQADIEEQVCLDIRRTEVFAKNSGRSKSNVLTTSYNGLQAKLISLRIVIGNKSQCAQLLKMMAASGSIL